MIVGAGLDKTGLMTKVAAVILRHGGSTEARIVPHRVAGDVENRDLIPQVMRLR